MPGKIAFFDMDGTVLAPYFRNPDGTDVRIGYPAGEWQSVFDGEGRDYMSCIQVQPVVEYARQLKADGAECHILTCCHSDGERKAKRAWFESAKCPKDIFSHIMFTESMDGKIEAVKALAGLQTIELSDCLIIDDDLMFCINARNAGIPAVHVSHVLVRSKIPHPEAVFPFGTAVIAKEAAKC